MDEASQESFYEDNLLVSGTTTEVKSQVKDEGLFKINSICYQSREKTPQLNRNELRANGASEFTVPDCDDQKCQVVIQQDINHTTSMSNSLPREHRTVPFIKMCGERSSIAKTLKDLTVTSQEYSAECATHFLPPGKNLHGSHESSKGDIGKSQATRDELYLDWNAQGQSKIELSNKVPASWPAIGVKSFVTERKVTPDQPTSCFFTLVKQANLLTDEQLQQIKELEHSDHSDQCPRSILKRNTHLCETLGSPAEKFAKMELDTEIENDSIEDREFFSQEETNNDCSDHARINSDQEVPFQEENGNSEVPDVEDGQIPGNAISTASFFGEKPFLNSEDSSFTWQDSTEDHFHTEKALFQQESNTAGPCAESFCLKFSKKSDVVLTGKTFSEREDSSAGGDGRASSKNAKHGDVEPLLTDQLVKSTECSEKRQTAIITKKEESSYDEILVVPSQSPSICKIACKYPPLPPRTPNDTGLCSSLRAIDERDQITSCLDDLDCSPIQPRKVSVYAEIPLLYEREEVDFWVSCNAFPYKTTSHHLERFSSSGPAINPNDTSAWHVECFDKVRLSECSDNLIHEHISLTDRAPSPINNNCLALENTVGNRNLTTNVTEDVKNCHLQVTCEEPPSEGSLNQEGMEIQTNCPSQGNYDFITTAFPDNTCKVFNVKTHDDTGSLMGSDDDNNNKENKRQCNSYHQENKNLGESSGIKDEEKISISNQDETDQFRTEIESKMIDLDGPELLQFAMIFVQGALKKSQIVPSCTEQLKCDENDKNISRVTPAFLWKSKIPYHSQQAPSLGTTAETFSNEAGRNVEENGVNGDTDYKEGPPHLVTPLPKTSSNRPLRLGLSRKHSNKPLHPYLKKHSNAKPN